MPLGPVQLYVLAGWFVAVKYIAEPSHTGVLTSGITVDKDGYTVAEIVRLVLPQPALLASIVYKPLCEGSALEICIFRPLPVNPLGPLQTYWVPGSEVALKLIV